MRVVSTAPVHQQVERKERASEPLVLMDVTPLVAPDRVGGLARGHDDVTEGDRGVLPAREDQVREPAVADVEEAAVAPARDREREETDEVADRIRVMREERRDQISGRCDRSRPGSPASRAPR